MQIVDKNGFLEITSKGTTLVDFYSDSCVPCKMLSPILEELSGEYDDVNFIKVDVYSEPELAAQYQIMSIPAVFLFKDGKAVAKTGGLRPKEDMKSFIDSNK